MNDAAAPENSIEALVGQVADEFMQRFARGEQPEIEEYLRRYPQFADVLRDVLAAVQLMHYSGPGMVPDGAVASPSAPLRGCLGDFRLVREIGRGGMGIVYEAEQISLDRRVALKVLPFAAALDPRQIQRFKNEALATASLHHPHIVPVYAVGSERGVHYYAMQLIEGQSLAAIIGELRMLSGLEPQAGDGIASEPANAPTPGSQSDPQAADSVIASEPRAETARHTAAAFPTERSTRSPAYFRTVADLGVQAAEALDHVHQVGVLHRDIKPGNLLLDLRGNLWITDFGLAHVQGDARLTRTGDVVGTLRYMSPEQALGQHGTVDARTDVYSLGVTLYELLTLEPAFAGADRGELLLQIAWEEPRPPRRVNEAVPAELETIVLKALAKNPAERYATAQELADDLHRWLEDRPIQAKRPTLLQRAAKWGRRHRTIVLSAVLSLFAVLAVTVSVLAYSNAQVYAALLDRTTAYTALELEQQKTERALAAREEEQRQTQRALNFHRIALADREWWLNNVREAEQVLDECPRELRFWEWHYLKRRCHKALLTLSHGNSLLGMALGPDGKHLATAGDGKVRIWDAATGKELRTIAGLNHRIFSPTFSPDGRLAAGSHGAWLVKVWEVQTGRELLSLPAKGRQFGIRSLVFSPDGKYLAGAEMTAHLVKVWDAANGDEVRTLTGHEGPVMSVAFSPDGRLLASGSTDKTVRVCEMATGRLLQKFGNPVEGVLGVTFSPDSQRLAAAGSSGFLRVYDLTTAAEILTLHHADEGATEERDLCQVAFSPNGKQLATADRSRVVRIWEVATGREVATYRGHCAYLTGLSFSPDGKRLVTASQDGDVRVWDTTAGPEALTLRGFNANMYLRFRPDGRLLKFVETPMANPKDTSEMGVYDALTGEKLVTLRGLSQGVIGVAMTPDGKRLATFTEDRIMRLWDAATGQQISSWSNPDAGRSWLQFSPDGGRLTVGGPGPSVLLVEAATGRPVRSFRWPVTHLGCVACSPDGKRLAAGGAPQDMASGLVHVWNVADGDLHGVLATHTGLVTALTFSRDGKRLATASQDGTVRLWDSATCEELAVLRGHTSHVLGVAFSPDGQRLASTSFDRTVKLWDAASGREILTLRGPRQGLSGVEFSPDGGRLVSPSLDWRTVLIWDGRPWKEP